MTLYDIKERVWAIFEELESRKHTEEMIVDLIDGIVADYEHKLQKLELESFEREGISDEASAPEI